MKFRYLGFLFFYLLSWLRARSVLSRIWFFVLAVHFLFLLSYCLQKSPISFKKAPKGRAFVRTLKLQAAEGGEKSRLLSQPSPLDGEKENKGKKKTEKKKENKPQTIHKSKPLDASIKKEKWREERDEVLNFLRASIASLHGNLDQSVSEDFSEIPKRIEELSIDTLPRQGKKREAGYHKALAEMLKKKLCLPEYGRVDLRLTLDKEGNVLAFEILSSQSEKNRFFVEENLSKLVFPSFSSYFFGEKQRTFVMILSNDI